jgi:hypothetical protein
MCCQVFRPLASLDRELITLSSAIVDLKGLVDILCRQPRVVDPSRPVPLAPPPLTRRPLSGSLPDDVRSVAVAAAPPLQWQQHGDSTVRACSAPAHVTCLHRIV